MCVCARARASCVCIFWYVCPLARTPLLSQLLSHRFKCTHGFRIWTSLNQYHGNAYSIINYTVYTSVYTAYNYMQYLLSSYCINVGVQYNTIQYTLHCCNVNCRPFDMSACCLFVVCLLFVCLFVSSCVLLYDFPSSI